MAVVIVCLYLMATIVAVWLLLRQPAGREAVSSLLWVFVLLMMLFEECHWFLPLMFPDTVAWPAQSLTDVFALAWRGVLSPTTLTELGLVTGGRLVALLSVFYGLFFAVRFGPVWLAFVRGMSMAMLSLLVLWVGCVAVAFVIGVLRVPDLALYGAMARGLGALAALLYQGNRLIVALKPISSPPPSGA